MKRLTCSTLVAGMSLAMMLAGGEAAGQRPTRPGRPTRQIPQEARTAAEMANAFAWDMYGQLGQEKGNLFFSPYSIHAALAMTSAGARTHTEEEMRLALRLTTPPDETHAALGALRQAVEPGEGAPYELAVANALWGQSGFDFRQEFLDTLARDYAAGLERVDYKADPEAVRLRINAWVEEKTRERIKDILQRGVITRDTRLTLANAIYFKGAWEAEFDKERTEKAPFHLAPGKTAEAPFMRQKRQYRHAETDDMQALALPYAGGELEMVVLLPKEKDGLAAVEKYLVAEGAQGIIRRMRLTEADVWLPRFKMTLQSDLAEPLAALGMKTAFTDRADFSGMTTEEPLFISAAVHKAFVEVNEEGTEAAAATVVVMSVTSAPLDPPKPVVFRADRPFLFLIRHVRTGCVLFMGRVADPTEG